MVIVLLEKFFDHDKECGVGSWVLHENTLRKQKRNYMSLLVVRYMFSKNFCKLITRLTLAFFQSRIGIAREIIFQTFLRVLFKSQGFLS